MLLYTGGVCEYKHKTSSTKNTVYLNINTIYMINSLLLSLISACSDIQ